MIPGSGWTALIRTSGGIYHAPVLAFTEDDDGRPCGWVVDFACKLHRAEDVTGFEGYEAAPAPLIGVVPASAGSEGEEDSPFLGWTVDADGCSRAIAS